MEITAAVRSVGLGGGREVVVIPILIARRDRLDPRHGGDRADEHERNGFAGADHESPEITHMLPELMNSATGCGEGCLLSCPRLARAIAEHVATVNV